MKKEFFYFIAVLITLITGFIFYNNKLDSSLPVVAIANYGPHTSLDAAIAGFKEQMKAEGFIENQTIHYEITDIGFDHALIPQTIASLRTHLPKAMVVVSTPVAQFAKGKVKNLPLVYSSVTDPVDVGLLQEYNKSDNNMTGSSDMQDLKSLLQFAKFLLPNAKSIGLLYATSDSNDTSLVKLMQSAALEYDMSVVAIPVEQAREVPIRMQGFKGKVDLIYVGVSGPIQPTLPAIAVEARKMCIPVFNADVQAVRDGLAIAGFGVDYYSVGRNTGKLVSAILHGKKISELVPIYPSAQDHHGVINKKLAIELGITIPSNIEVVE